LASRDGFNGVNTHSFKLRAKPPKRGKFNIYNYLCIYSATPAAPVALAKFAFGSILVRCTRNEQNLTPARRLAVIA
jgi:hypothetical protein